ncbi:hypothetical protein A9Q96_10060 [Rhodobacterales bacterium 52_120_T64]|nr:hypothetical protein A9Q96_10060 [Rhodobacterales bacterium 52_120_T64]
MINKINSIIFAAMFTFWSGQSVAQDIKIYTSEFGQQVRAYLLDNPEVLLDMFTLLEQEQAQIESTQSSKVIRRNAEQLFLSGDDNLMGNFDAEISIVEFSDYRCSYCKANHPILQEFVAANPNVKVIVKDFPILGDVSELATRVALSIRTIYGAEDHSQFHELLLAYKGNLARSEIKLFAESLGFSFAEIEAVMDTDAISEIISTNKALAAELGIQGTPAFVTVRGVASGMHDLTALTALVDGL